MKLRIDEIKVRPGRRYAIPDDIESLAESIKAVGLLNPVTVDTDHTLIAGLHRLKAAERLGWTEIECTICDVDSLHAELAEIDENYVRANLTPLESSKILLRRKQIYEELYPETKAGAAQGNGMKRAAAEDAGADLADNLSARSVPKTFAEDTADKLGIDPRTVRRQVQIAKDLSSEAQEIIENAGAKVTQQNLIKLAKLPVEQQKEAASWLVTEKCRSVDDYLQQKEYAELAAKAETVITEDPNLPFKIVGTKYHSVAESIAALKTSEGKDRCDSSDTFMVDIVGYLNNFQKGLEMYYDDHYSCVFPEVTKEQMAYLRDRMHDACQELAELLSFIEHPEVEKESAEAEAEVETENVS